jgi:cytochrome b561
VKALRAMDPRQQAALALGSFLLLADLLVLLVTGEFNVALGGAGVSIFGLAFTLPRDNRHNGTGAA